MQLRREPQHGSLPADPGAHSSAWYFGETALAAATLSMRAFLGVVSVFDAAALPREIARVRRWLSGAEVVMFSLVLVAAGLLAASAPTMSGILLIIGIGGFAVVLFVEPLMAAAAFPELATATSAAQRDRTLSRRAGLAVLQLLMTAPWLWTCVQAGAALLGEGEKVVRTEQWPWFVGIFMALAIVAGSGLSLASAMAHGRTSTLRNFVRWFPAFLLLSIASVIVALLIGLRLYGLAGGLPALLLAFVPFIQRRLAQQLLDISR